MSLRRSARARPSAADDSPDGAPSSAASTSSANASPSKPGRETRKRKRDGQSAGVEGTPELTAGPGLRSTKSRGALKQQAAEADAEGEVDDSGDMDVDASQDATANGSAAHGKPAKPLKRIAKVEALDPRKGEALLPELLLQSAEAEKLRVIVEVYAPELLHATADNIANRPAKVNGKARSKPTLKMLLADVDAASETRTSLRSLREFLETLRSKLSAKLEGGSAAAQISKKLGAVRVLTSLVDSIAQSYRDTPAAREAIAAALEKRSASGKVKDEAGEQTASAKKDEEEEEDLESASFPAAAKYALHMRLPLGGDYFTNAVKLGPLEAANLDAGHADLVSVAPRSRRQRDLSPPPTIGERCLPGRLNRLQPERLVEKPPAERAVCATRLYYGPWASFAPAYDTADSTLGLASSQLLWQSRHDELRSLRRLGWLPAQSVPPASITEQIDDKGEEEQSAETVKPEPTTNGASFDESLLEGLDGSLDPALLKAGLQHLSEREAIDKVLQENAGLFKELQELQLQRLRKSYAAARTAGARTLTDAVDEPDEQEAATARRLLDSLTSLVALRPNSEAGSLLPSKEVLHAAARASTVIDPRLLSTGEGCDEGETGYWGTLDEKSYGPDAAYRKATVYAAWSDPRSNVAVVPASAGPAALKENDTVMPKTQTPLRAEPPTTVAPKHKRSLLDRVAGSRSYSADADRHAEAPVPPGGGQGAPGARGVPPQQPRRGMSQSGPVQSPGGGAGPGMAQATPARSYANIPGRVMPPGQPQPQPHLQQQQHQQQQQRPGGPYMTPVANRSGAPLQPPLSGGPQRTVQLPNKMTQGGFASPYGGVPTPQTASYAHTQSPAFSRPSVMGGIPSQGPAQGMTQSMVSSPAASGGLRSGAGGYLPSGYPQQVPSSSPWSSVSAGALAAPMSTPSPLSPAHGQRALPGGVQTSRPHQQQGMGYMQGQMPSAGWNGR